MASAMLVHALLVCFEHRCDRRRGAALARAAVARSAICRAWRPLPGAANAARGGVALRERLQYMRSSLHSRCHVAYQAINMAAWSAAVFPPQSLALDA